MRTLEELDDGASRERTATRAQALRRRLTSRRLFVGAILLAALLRLWAVALLPADFDEPVYGQAALDYARYLRTGDLGGLIAYDDNRAHPALVKLVYAVGLLALPARAVVDQAVIGVARLISAAFGTLAVLAVALAGGWAAGALLAAHTLAVKYTSQAYLEALPHFASTVAVLAFVRLPPPAEPGSRPRLGPWFWLSAALLGVAAAGKLTYVPAAVVVILYLATFEKNLQWPAMLPYFLLAGLVFLALNPQLWPNPLVGLADMVFFHVRYSQSAAVEQVGYPWYQPLVWVSTSAPSRWHPDVFFYYGFDGLVFWLAAFGLPREWRERRWLVVWLAAGLLFLLAWPTRWPQYALIVTPALCLMAAATAGRLVRRLREAEAYWGWLSIFVPDMPRYAWVTLGLFLAFIGAIYLWGFLGVALGSLGWSHLTAQNSLLPSNTVYAVLPLADGRMVLGTERGAVVWPPGGAGELGEAPQVFDAGNSGLPATAVLAAASDATGRLWFGTPAGAASYDGATWQTFRAADLGLAEASVQALAVGSGGAVYAATLSGAAAWDGTAWTAWTTANSGLADDRVLAVATRPGPEGEEVWFGTLFGLSRRLPSGEWETLAAQDTGLGSRAVADLAVDSAGRLWAASLGAGVSAWDGANWRNYRPANSDLPNRLVNTVVEAQPGVLWFGTSQATNVGGALASFDGARWHTYLPRNSGFSGAEPLDIAVDAAGTLWVGTRTAGIALYDLDR